MSTVASETIVSHHQWQLADRSQQRIRLRLKQPPLYPVFLRTSSCIAAKRLRLLQRGVRRVNVAAGVHSMGVGLTACMQGDDNRNPKTWSRIEPHKISLSRV